MGKTLLRSNFRSQSAMEYLMTYGWAILIVAVVLVALFSLGLFNSGTNSPTVPPGSCQVIRNVAGISLAGLCNNAFPQFVASFNAVSQSIVTTPKLNVGTHATLTAWVSPTAQAEPWGGIIMQGQNYDYAMGFANACELFWGGGGGGTFIYAPYWTSTQQWTFWVCEGTEGGGAVQLFLNGQQVQSGTTGSQVPTSGPWSIGANYNGGSPEYFFNGMISNVQIYNTTLDSSDILRLYDEGIGGDPVDPINLVAWYPLNGNAQDYSGNNNNAQASGISYLGISAWYSGYTQP